MNRSCFLLWVVLVVLGCAATESRIRDIQARYPQWGPTIVAKVARHQVEPGMSPEMVIAALGRPDRVSQAGGREKWAYATLVTAGQGAVYVRDVYFVYFREDRVVRTEGDRRALGYWR